MTAATRPAPRTRIRRHAERTQPVPEAAEAVLAEGLVAHVGLIRDGLPVVLPFTYHYQDGHLYLHGAPATGMLKLLRAGAPVCVEVTLADALIASRSAETHSVNYRSAVLFGTARIVKDREHKRQILEAMIARYFPGRTAGVDYEHITAAEYKMTEVFEVEIEAMSAKARSGGPKGERDADPTAPGSAGIVPLHVAGSGL